MAFGPYGVNDNPGASPSVYDAALREVWTSDRLEDQLYQNTVLLDRIDRGGRNVTIGGVAVTPVHVSRNGGYTALPQDGGYLNSPGRQGIRQAQWNYAHHNLQIKIQGSAIDMTGGRAEAVANVIDVEVTGALADLRQQITRQLYMDGSARIAPVTGIAGNVVTLDAQAGMDAITRGWLFVGAPVDIGTNADEESAAADRIITAVDPSDPANPRITVSGAAPGAGANTFVSWANSRDGATSFEMNGLPNIVSQTGVLGGIDPTAVPLWSAASVDNTAQDLSLGLLYGLQRAVMQSTGNQVDFVVTSLKQQAAFYALLQAQARFVGDTNLGAGNVGGAQFAGMPIVGDPNAPDGVMFFLSLKNLFLVNSGRPRWQNFSTNGGQSALDWIQGEDAYGAKLTYRVNLATDRRNAHAALTNLN